MHGLPNLKIYTFLLLIISFSIIWQEFRMNGEKWTKRHPQIQRVLSELRHSALPDGYEHEDSIYIEFPKSGRIVDVERRRMETRLKDSIPLSQRRDSAGTSSTDKEYRWTWRRRRGGEQKKKVVAKSMKGNYLKFEARTALNRRPLFTAWLWNLRRTFAQFQATSFLYLFQPPLNPPPTQIPHPSTPAQYLHDLNLIRTKPISAFLLRFVFLAECSCVGLEVMW